MTMKLSIDQAFTCNTFGLEGGLQILKDAGFDSLDWGFFRFNPKEQLFSENFREQMADIRALLKGLGFDCDQTHSPIPTRLNPLSFHFGDEMDMSCPAFADMVNALEASAILGAKQSVYHSLAVPQGGDSQQHMDFNYAYFKALEPYARDFGIKICIENLEKISGNLYKVERQNELLDRLDSDQFCALVDLGHAAASETTPDAHLRALKRGRVQGLHFHDFNTQDAHVIPGLGGTDWDKVAEALVDIGYEGNLTMEIDTYKLFPKTMYLTVLKFAVASGRSFIRKVEKARAAKV